MGIKSCEDCGQEISDRAVSCPQCGAPPPGTGGTQTATGWGANIQLADSGETASVSNNLPKSKYKFSVLGIIVLVLLFFMFYGGDSADQSGQGAAPSPPSPSEYIKARKLGAAYQSNEVRADQLYKGRGLMVTGPVSHIKKDLLGSPYIVLDSGGPVDVHCTFPRTAEANLAALRPGQTVTLIGTCKGKIMDVQLGDCVLKW